jgi:hypothetical protein
MWWQVWQMVSGCVSLAHQYVLQCCILTGDRAGTEVYIPRVPLEAKGESVFVPFQRLQFPVRPGYVVTINRSQGQTYSRVGLLLPSPVFAHGLLYVALSRVATFRHVSALIGSESSRAVNSRPVTVNVVNRDVMRAATNMAQLHPLHPPPQAERHYDIEFHEFSGDDTLDPEDWVDVRDIEADWGLQ